MSLYHTHTAFHRPALNHTVTTTSTSIIRTYLIISMLSSITHYQLYSAPSIQKITTFFSRTLPEEIEQKKYEIPSITTLIVKNLSGDITVTTTPTVARIESTISQQPPITIFMKAIKKASTPEQCKEITISSLLESNTLTISTDKTAAAYAGKVDYHLIIPAHISLTLETNKGNIHTDDTFGITMITTTHGNINCSNTHQTVTAQTKEVGSITIEQSYKPIYATTKKGAILIQDALDSITASAEKGAITAHCTQLPAQSCIYIRTTNGPITLHLPHAIHASVHASSVQGTVTCDHLITIDPHTTRLNTHAWSMFKKEVRGKLGKDATIIPSSAIVLNSIDSGIKIRESACT